MDADGNLANAPSSTALRTAITGDGNDTTQRKHPEPLGGAEGASESLRQGAEGSFCRQTHRFAHVLSDALLL